MHPHLLFDSQATALHSPLAGEEPGDAADDRLAKIDADSRMPSRRAP